VGPGQPYNVLCATLDKWSPLTVRQLPEGGGGMSGRVGHRKRLICVNAANLRQNHLYLTGHADFFPADSFLPRPGLPALAP
jgi:hypothetical protein